MKTMTGINKILQSSITKEEEFEENIEEFTPPTEEEPKTQDVEGQGEDRQDVSGQDDSDYDDLALELEPEEEENGEVALLIVILLGYISMYGVPLLYEMVNKKPLYLSQKQIDSLDFTPAKEKRISVQVDKVLKYYDIENKANPVFPLMLILAKHYTGVYKSLADIARTQEIEKPAKRTYTKRK